MTPLDRVEALAAEAEALARAAARRAAEVTDED